MTLVLRYGSDSSLAVEPSEGTLLGQCGTTQVLPVADIRAEVRRALAEPLDYPPFSAVVTPGDRVVVALADEVTASAEILSAVIACLVESRVDPDSITVLRPAGSRDDDPCRLLPSGIRGQIISLCHAPHEPESLAYLASTRHGQAIMLHRAIVDADLVLPIGRFRGDLAAGYHGIHTPVYPTFSSRETLCRFRAAATLDSRGRHRRQLSREADEVGWLLGTTFTVQTMPAGGDRVSEVLAGRVEAVRRRGMELYSAFWHGQVARRPSLVVAAIEGGAAEQTWANLGRVMETGAALVEEGGALAVCTELADPPGDATQSLRIARSREEALRQIRDEEADDAVTAVQLARALDHCSVYLMSRLDDALVEDLEMTPVGDEAELNRLVGRSESVFVLGNASYAGVTVEEEIDDER